MLAPVLTGVCGECEFDWDYKFPKNSYVRALALVPYRTSGQAPSLTPVLVAAYSREVP